MTSRSPTRTGRKTAREAERARVAAIRAGAEAIRLYVRGDATRGPPLPIQTELLEGVLGNAIGTSEGLISSNLLSQAEESEAGARKLAEALKQLDSPQLQDYDIQDEPLTHEEADEAAAHRIALALTSSYVPSDSTGASPLPIAVREAIATMTEPPIPDHRASSETLQSYLRSLIIHLKLDSLEEARSGLIIDETQEECYSINTELIDVPALSRAFQEVWNLEISRAELLTSVTFQSEQNSEKSPSDTEDDEEDSDADDGLETDEHERGFEMILSALNKADMTRRYGDAVGRTHTSKLNSLDDLLERQGQKLERLESAMSAFLTELKATNLRLKLMDRHLAALSREAPGPAASLSQKPVALRPYSNQQIDNLRTQLNESHGDVLATIAIYEKLGAPVCQALLDMDGIADFDESDASTTTRNGSPGTKERAPRTSAEARNRWREPAESDESDDPLTARTGGLGGPRSREEPDRFRQRTRYSEEDIELELRPHSSRPDLGGTPWRRATGRDIEPPQEDDAIGQFMKVHTFRASGEGKGAKITVKSVRNVMTTMTGLHFDTKSGALLDKNNKIITQSEIKAAVVESAILGATPALSAALQNNTLSEITDIGTVMGTPASIFKAGDTILLVNDLSKVADNPTSLWMKQDELRSNNIGVLQNLLNVLGGGQSRESRLAMGFVKEWQDDFANSFRICEGILRKCLNDQPDEARGLELFRYIINIVINTVNQHLQTIEGALAQSLTAQYVIAKVLSGDEDTFYLATKHPTMRINARPGRSQGKVADIMVRRLEIGLNPYESDSDTEETPFVWNKKSCDEWKAAAMAATTTTAQANSLRNKIKYLNGRAKAMLPKATGVGAAAVCSFCAQSDTASGGHKSEDCENLSIYMKKGGGTGDPFTAGCEAMGRLNKALVAKMVKAKITIAKLAPVLPGGAHFKE